MRNMNKMNIMKLAISLISILFLSFTPIDSKNLNLEISTSNVVDEQLIFDGYEGGYYFFSNADYEAVVLGASEENTPYELINGNLEGELFIVSYKHADDGLQTSSEGSITAVTLKN